MRLRSELTFEVAIRTRPTLGGSEARMCRRSCLGWRFVAVPGGASPNLDTHGHLLAGPGDRGVAGPRVHRGRVRARPDDGPPVLRGAGRGGALAVPGHDVRRR